MKLPIKDIIHCSYNKAPFIGAIITIGDRKQNKREMSDVMAEVLDYKGIALFQNSEPYFQIVEPSQEPCFQTSEPCFQKNEGLILEGDWENYPLQLYEILEIAGKNSMQVVIGIKSNLSNLEYNLGSACAKRIFKTTNIDSTIIPQDEKKVYNFIGSVILDYFLPYTYYVKVGGKTGKKTPSREQFGISLETNKQYVIKMESRKGDMNES